MIDAGADAESLKIAQRWCVNRGLGWSVLDQAGRGGTAPVYTVRSPDALLALKIYDERFSRGEQGKIEEKRIDQQLSLRDHDCPYLVNILDGGVFEGRLFVLMNKATGHELEKKLSQIPRNKIRTIVDQIARAIIFLRSKNLCHRDIKSANIFISEDFDKSTLLDLSVLRGINDPVGIGTDHDGQLPVVATARYSPPEYLFRLADADEKFWHALDIYQLGALLHDLIMRRPLFEDEYNFSKENRYRFAWIIATRNPILIAPDVDQDLIYLARRALDKDWQKRATITIEEFLNDRNINLLRAAKLLGLGNSAPIAPNFQPSAHVRRRQRVSALAQSIDARVTEALRGQGVTARHHVAAGTVDAAKVITFEWDLRAPLDPAAAMRATYAIRIQVVGDSEPFSVMIEATLSAATESEELKRTTSLPELSDVSGVEDQLVENVQSAITQLAAQIFQTG